VSKIIFWWSPVLSVLWDNFSLLGPCSLGTLYVDITEKFTFLLLAEKKKAENFQQDGALPYYNSNVHNSWTQDGEGKGQLLPNLDEHEWIISVADKLVSPEMLRCQLDICHAINELHMEI
jgi:hypothetical protein